MWFLRQSTASQEIPLGPFVDSTDGNTQETALSIANTDIKLHKTGATSEASKNSGGATHIANGRYYCVLDATDTDTIGPLRVYVHVSGALAVWLDCCVLDEAVYDVLFGTTAPSTYAGADTSGTTTLLSRIGGVIDVTNLNTLSGHDPGATLGTSTLTQTQVTGGSYSIQSASCVLGDARIANLDAAVSTRGTGTALDAAGVRSAVGLASANLDTQIGTLATAANLATVAGYLDTEIAAILADTNELQTDWVDGGRLDLLIDGIKSKTDQFVFTVANQVDANALSGGGGLDAAGVRSAIGLASANLDTQLAAIDDYLDSEVAAIKAKTDNLPSDPADQSAVEAAITAATTALALEATAQSILADTGTDGVVVAAGSKTGYALTTAYDVYHADIQFTVDGDNTQDEYTVTWFKNGIRHASGITSPTVQVVKRVDGTNLVASTAMTQIGSTGSYKYDEDANRIAAGEAVLVLVAATIDGSSRTFARIISRDSA